MPRKKAKPPTEAQKLRQLVHRMENVKSMHGKAWCDNMAAHYRRKYAELTGRELPKRIRL